MSLFNSLNLSRVTAIGFSQDFQSVAYLEVKAAQENEEDEFVEPDTLTRLLANEGMDAAIAYVAKFAGEQFVPMGHERDIWVRASDELVRPVGTSSSQEPPILILQTQ